MRKTLLIIGCILFLIPIVHGQKKGFKLNHKYAKNVVNSIFHAARSGSFDHLATLCDPNGFGDRDVKRICSIAQLAHTIAASEASESAKANLAEFVDIFEDGKITGDVIYENEGDTEFARVPIWYDHPLGDRRSNETMVLVKRTGKWYLYSF